MNQFILIINGPICSGKTTVIDSIMSNYKKVFRLSANKIKFLISDYNPARDRTAVHECLVIIAEKMLESGMSLVLEGGSMAQGDLNESLERVAQKHVMKITTVNIEAPLEVLEKRFNERVKTSLARGKKISVTDRDGFMERYNVYLAIKSKSEKTFDSSVLNGEEIAKQIMELV